MYIYYYCSIIKTLFKMDYKGKYISTKEDILKELKY